jgi:hypothetical protein
MQRTTSPLAIARRAAAAAALLVGIAAGAGCAEVERAEVPLKLVVETTPPGAAVSVLTTGSKKAVALGSSPLALDRLFITCKIYPSDEIDYWLRDGAHVLPMNAQKPPYASPAYLAGNDYPYELWFVASLPGHKTAVETVRIDRWRLKRLLDEPNPTIKVALWLPRVGLGEGAGAGGAPPKVPESIPRGE